jgi:hypothetical protein
MLLAEFIRETQLAVPAKCTGCEKQAEIFMTGYAENSSNLVLCRACALQLSRKLLEDLCELAGDRHG